MTTPQKKVQRSLSALISAGKERPILSFRRKFKERQLSTLAKFLTYYLIEFRQIAKEDIKSYTIAYDRI